MTLTPEQEAILRAMVEDARWDARELHRIVGESSLASARADALEAALTEITELRERQARIFAILNDPKRSHIYARIAAKAVAAHALAPFDEEGT